MAGLLDIFGTGGTDSLGLLGMSADDIQRQRDDAQAQALYALAANLFKGGPTGLSIAEGLSQGQQAYKGAMKSALEDQLTTYKLAEAKKAKERENAVAGIMAKAYTPAQAAVTPSTPMFDLLGQEIAGPNMPKAATQAGYNLQAVAPQLIQTAEGRKALTEMVAANKALMPEYKVVGDYLYQITPEGATQIAGQQKGPSSYQEFQMAATNPAYAKFLQDQTAAKAPKIAVDLKDPTAVAKAQSDLVKDWRAVVKDFGANEVADRFKAAQQAVIEGDKGNKASDGALIYAIAKIYDPSGAVQEGDKKSITGNRSIPDTVKAYAQRAFSGQDLLPHERQNLLNMASRIVQEKSKNIDAQMAPYKTLSRNLGGTGELLLNPLSGITTQMSTSGSANDIAAAARAEIERRRGGR